MANESFALLRQQQPDGVEEDDYQSFCEALGASARGRAFLHEYARRNRHADTEVVLTALDRLEEAARSQKAAPEADRIRQDLRALLDTLRNARPQVDGSPGAIRAATLAALIDFAQARIEALVAMPDDVREHGMLAQSVLAAVPASDQPELPIPQPDPQLPNFALVHSAPPVAERQVSSLPPARAEENIAASARAALRIPIVEFDYSTPAKPANESQPQAAPAREVEPYELWLDEPASEIPASATPVDETTSKETSHDASQDAPSGPAGAGQGSAQVTAHGTAIEALVQQLETQADAAAKSEPAPPADPLAPIMALTEEERIALFT